MDLNKDDVHLLARILSAGLVDADPNYLHHLKGYRDLQGRWAPQKYTGQTDTGHSFVDIWEQNPGWIVRSGIRTRDMLRGFRN